jgi:BNR repeat-like domain
VVLVSYSEQFDSRYYPQRLRTERSVDGGKTFTPLASDVPINSMTQLADGSLVALDFRTGTPTTRRPGGRTTPAHPLGGGVKQFQTTLWRSHDYGATWVEQHGTISAGDAYDAVFFHRGILAGRNGSLLATTHGYLHGEHRYRSMLARSTDGGATWRIVSTIAKSPPGWKIEGRSEPTMARAANGDLVVVMRQSSPVSPNVCNGSRQGAGLVISRSSNEGVSWTPARSLVGAGLDARNVSSADPHLTRMPGGQLILSYGRPGNKILISTDGNGTTWSNLTVTKTGVSSGYTSIVALTNTTALQVGDHGSNWCFLAETGLHRVGIWTKTITLGPTLQQARLSQSALPPPMRARFPASRP